jgi:hypothetical protein
MMEKCPTRGEVEMKNTWRAGIMFSVVIIVGIAVVGIKVFSVVAHDAKLRGHQVGMRSHIYALLNYAEHNDNRFPKKDLWPDILFDHGYLEDSLFEYVDLDGDDDAYIYLSNQIVNDKDSIVLYEDPKHWDEGVIVGFADAHVEFMSFVDFERVLAEQLASGEP